MYAELKVISIALIAVLAIGGLLISLGVLTNQNYDEISEISSQYDKLEKYKNELEKINLHNQKMLQDLEEQIKMSDDVNLIQINHEINVIKKVISENKAELENIIKKLSQMEPGT